MSFKVSSGKRQNPNLGCTGLILICWLKSSKLRNALVLDIFDRYKNIAKQLLKNGLTKILIKTTNIGDNDVFMQSTPLKLQRLFRCIHSNTIKRVNISTVQQALMTLASPPSPPSRRCPPPFLPPPPGFPRCRCQDSQVLQAASSRSVLGRLICF